MSLAEPRAALATAPPTTAPSQAPAPAAARSDAGAIGLSTRAAALLLGGLGLAALLVQGGVFFEKSWLWTGDTIYHRAVMAEI